MQYKLTKKLKQKGVVMPRPAIKWLLVEWNTEEFEVISVKSVVKSGLKLSDLTTGKLITVSVDQNEVPAKIVMSSDDRKFLEQQILPMTIHKKEPVEPAEVYPKIYEDAEQIKSPAKDFSPSASSWTAEEWDTSSASSSSEEEQVILKNIKKEKVKRKYTKKERGSKVPTPSLKLQPIIPNCMKVNGSNSLCDQSILQRSNGLPDRLFISQINMSDSSITIGQNTRRRMMYDQQVQTDPIILPSREDIIALQKELQSCREIIHNAKEALSKVSPILNTTNVLNALTGHTPKSAVNISKNNETINQSNGKINPHIEPKEVYETLHDSTNSIIKQGKKRKAEIMLTNGIKVEKNSPARILNGTLDYSINTPELPTNNTGINQLEVTNNSVNNTNEKVEMVPIGSGKTLIEKSIYDEINWSSYTMATRKLLMAVFPRSVLATHSLTGKSSPAFMNKPPKLSLDPRKVSDIVWTVTKMCKVKENLVRSAITIKCADENKMLKFQHLKKSAKKSKKQTQECQTFNDESNSD